MRVGYAARAGLYALVGVLTSWSALSGGDGEGTEEAFESLSYQIWGDALLSVIAGGLVAFCLWRIFDAVFDLDEYGADAKGVVSRASLAVTGLLYLFVAFTAAEIALLSEGRDEVGSSAERATGAALAQPFGPWLVMAFGLGFLVAGVYYFRKALAETYKENIRDTRLTEALESVCKYGLMAHGVLLLFIGVFLVFAGWTVRAEEAGGIGEVFQAVRGQPFGRWLLGFLGLGMIAFAVYCLVEAFYRIVPKASGDTETLASRAERLANAAG